MFFDLIFGGEVEEFLGADLFGIIVSTINYWEDGN